MGERDRSPAGVKVHQTLHGYAGGHRLLEASRQLPPEIERVLLLFSDLSGSTMQRGFEEYLTGYPLLGSGLYALARTWYAPEMDRPGCVWTHTLLIGAGDLTRLPNANALLRLFTLPQKGGPWTYYGSPLLAVSSVEEAGAGAARSEGQAPPDPTGELASRILAALYTSPSRPVYLGADSSRQHESLILAVWDEQWPELRTSFSFCTGSLANRMLGDSPLDIQVMPQMMLDSIRRSTPASHTPALNRPPAPEEVPAWSIAAACELSAPGPRPLKQFLWRFGHDWPSERPSFQSVTETFLVAQEVQLRRRPVGELTELVARTHPDPRAGVDLKVALFGVVGEVDQVPLALSEVESLGELAITRHGGAFDPKSLRLQDRAQAFARDASGDAHEIALRVVEGEVTCLGEAFLTGLAAGIAPDDAAALGQRSRVLLLFLIGRNPALATSVLLWRYPEDQQLELLGTLLAGNLGDRSVWGGILAAMLEARSDVRAEEVAQRCGDDSARAVLDWYDGRELDDPDQVLAGWRKVLSSRPMAALDWLASRGSARDATVALVISVLDPRWSALQDQASETWCSVARRGLPSLSARAQSRVAAFLLVLGFAGQQPNPCELVGWAFPIVHKAAAEDRLDYESWQMLADLVPTLVSWRNWDRCERLRRAFVYRCWREGWSVDCLLRALANDDAFSKAVDYCRTETWGRELLKRVSKTVAAGEAQATAAQRGHIAKYR